MEKDIDFTIGALKTFPTYKACLYGKQSRKKFLVNQARRASQLLELIHSNLIRLLPNSLRGLQYFIAFIVINLRYISYLIQLKRKLSWVGMWIL